MREDIYSPSPDHEGWEGAWTPTMDLAWDANVLMQRWSRYTTNRYGVVIGAKSEWRPVPSKESE